MTALIYAMPIGLRMTTSTVLLPSWSSSVILRGGPTKFKETYRDVRLVRNEKAVKLDNFTDGAGFEPDFLLSRTRR